MDLTPFLTYAYDTIGNMTNNSRVGSYLYNSSGTNSVRPHAVKTAGGTNYLYDANGNMTDGNGRTLVFDYEDRLSSVDKNSIATTFVYNGNGKRIKKTVAGKTTFYIGKHYFCDPATCTKMIFAGKRRVAQIKTLHSGPQVSALIVALGGSISYYHTNHIDSTDVVTNAFGRSEQNIVYYPYGKTHGTSGDNGVDYKFTGKEFDDSTGLYFYEARYYDAELGRFISADTIVPNTKNPQSFNRYSYVLNNPLKFTDPSGNKPKKNREKIKKKLKRKNKRKDTSAIKVFIVPNEIKLGQPKSLPEFAKDFAPLALPFVDGPLPFGDAAAIIIGAGAGKKAAKEVSEIIFKQLKGLEKRGFRPDKGERTFQGVVDKATQAGNPTVGRNSKELFRLRSKSHGQAGASVTPLNVRNVRPSDGKVFTGEGPIRSVTNRDIRELHKAQTGHGKSTIRTRGGR